MKIIEVIEKNCSENVQKHKYQKLILSYFKVFNRVEFSNSGSEANLRALRICRAITKKNKFVILKR